MSKKKRTVKSVLIKNFSYLSAIQVFNLVLPLITYPYLIRVLGSFDYGWVAYSLSLAAFFTILVNYGFNISGTRAAAVSKDNLKKLSEIFSSILIIKILLFFTLLIFGSFFVFRLDYFANKEVLVILALLTPVSEVLLPVWFFQGLERMNFITLLSLTSKSIYTALVLLLIKKPDDAFLVPAFLLTGTLFAGLGAVFIINKLSVRLVWPGRKVVYKYFKESSPFFFSRISSVAIQESGSLLIGSFIGMREVSYFDIAKKIVQIYLIPYNILNQTIFPYIARTLDMTLVKKALTVVLFTGVLAFIVNWWAGGFIVGLIGGKGMEPSITPLRILSSVIVLNGLSYFLGNTVLVVNNYSKYFNQSIILSFFFFALLVAFVYLFKMHSLEVYAFMMVIVGLFDVLYRWYFVRRLSLLSSNS